MNFVDKNDEIEQTVDVIISNDIKSTWNTMTYTLLDTK